MFSPLQNGNYGRGGCCSNHFTIHTRSNHPITQRKLTQCCISVISIKLEKINAPCFFFLFFFLLMWLLENLKLPLWHAERKPRQPPGSLQTCVSRLFDDPSSQTARSRASSSPQYRPRSRPSESTSTIRWFNTKFGVVCYTLVAGTVTSHKWQRAGFVIVIMEPLLGPDGWGSEAGPKQV